MPHLQLLAFTPLFDPLTALYPGMDDYWLWLAIPLVLAISIIYKGTRVEKLRQLPLAVGILSFEILIGMAFAAFALGLFYNVATRLF
jgi:hypothetical protein